MTVNDYAMKRVQLDFHLVLLSFSIIVDDLIELIANIVIQLFVIFLFCLWKNAFLSFGFAVKSRH